MKISTGVWGLQHPNAGQNIQQKRQPQRTFINDIMQLGEREVPIFVTLGMEVSLKHPFCLKQKNMASETKQV